MIFPNSGEREEIALKGRVVDGDLVDPTAVDDVDLPKPHPNQKIQDGGASRYWEFPDLRSRDGKSDGDEG
jgi:hypothetical protein